MSVTYQYIQLLKESQPSVQIPVEKGALGLSIDSPIKAYKRQLTSGKKDWGTLSKQVNTLAIFNKNKHPSIASKARGIRNNLEKFVEKKREENPNFAS